MDDETFQGMLDVNLNSVFHILRAAIPPMRQTGNGRIIAIGSRAALEPGAGVGVLQRFQGGRDLFGQNRGT